MEEAIVIVGSAALVITVLVVPFYIFINMIMKRWDGSDKTKQYGRE